MHCSPVDDTKQPSPVVDTLPEYAEEAFSYHVAGEAVREGLFTLISVSGGVFFPFLRLCCLNEGEEGVGIKGKTAVECVGISFGLSPLVHKEDSVSVSNGFSV